MKKKQKKEVKQTDLEFAQSQTISIILKENEELRKEIIMLQQELIKNKLIKE